MSAGTRERRPLLDVREIVLVALLASIGGVLSTYVGYIGNLINRLFGVPFGAGQLIAGLHVLWPILARLLIGKFGSGTLTGVTKGAIELLSGGTHGVVIVLVSFVEGLLVDLGMGIFRRPSLLLTMLTAAIASASNVFIFQAIYFSGVSPVFILVMAALSLVSGAFFGGYLGWDVRRFLIASRLVPQRTEEPVSRGSSWWRRLLTLTTVLALLAGGVYYYTSVYDPFSSPDSARIEGALLSPYTFCYSDWGERAVTIVAELRGSSTYIPPQEYTGVLLSLILEEGEPKEGAQTVRVIAEDGYEASFDLPAALEDEHMILSLDDGRLRLIAAGYDGAYWVKRVSRIVVR
jgi:energy-coupling factor transport system substrate-specific component